jgi:hypothetical protein
MRPSFKALETRGCRIRQILVSNRAIALTACGFCGIEQDDDRQRRTLWEGSGWIGKQ